MKVATILGTRPEIIRLSRVIALLERETDHVLVHTGQNFDYELNEIFFEQLELAPPRHFLNSAGSNPAETIGKIISASYEVLRGESPEALLILGDTNSCLAAISAKRLHIPIFHMEAGNRCFDQRVPEETNRRIVDHISDINLTYTEHARRYLLGEGMRPETVIKTGSPLKEALSYYLPRMNTSDVLQTMELKPKGYFLVSAHREENIDSPQNFSDLVDTLNGMAERYRLPIIVSTHPRTRKRLDESQTGTISPLVRFSKPLGLIEYCKLQLDALCVISDSGSITEESSILNFPAITIRQAHERPEGMDEGVLIMSGLKRNRVTAAIDVVTRVDRKARRIVSDYDSDNVSQKVLYIILSYTEYVNRTVWGSTN
jgi:UDP-N-acetylglucosamine 2-epimerase (non-hydrolysing)